MSFPDMRVQHFDLHCKSNESIFHGSRIYIYVLFSRIIFNMMGATIWFLEVHLVFGMLA